MKIYFGFNDIRQDGMGTEAMCLMRTLKAQGLEVQPVHAWKQIEIPGYIEEFDPVFISDSIEMDPIPDVIEAMVNYLNSIPKNSVFSHFGSPNWACVIPYLRSDIKVVSSVHSITPSALKIATAYKERVSSFVAISWEVENRLRKYLPKEYSDKIILITNAINPNEYPQKKFSALANNPIRIVFFGRIEDVTKGCDKIPQIAKKLKEKGLNFVWDFYGYFHWGYEERFYALNKQYDVEDVVNYKCCLQPNEVADKIKDYDIFVLTSNHEGFGLALIEAMTVGLACVASHIHDVTDHIIADGKEGVLCERNDINAFAEAIYKLACDTDVRIAMGKAAREKVIREFSVRRQGREYRQLFEKIVNTNGYQLVEPKRDLKHFVVPEMTKPHILARIFPLWLKKILKRYV
ncbi:MAG: glycosyltransferase family 4 protein [Ruminococcus flavefaciens]|nr:glycosyltransferase family 4 protein [Bacteroides sp.]MCM1233515.1 glycosyltransferase family 4 protein [Ruminococcus flavefaciens]